ncbi:MAG: SusE domain-containing protein [Chitinophagaceae bacterium]|nr:SusE domain-containing protein [Chitinophagaceae bacterium]
MKHIFNIFLAAIILLLASCNKEKKLDHTAVTTVENFFIPEDNKFVKLLPTTSASVEFEWEQARAEDGGVVLYEVAFIAEGGDFNSPAYKMVSDNNGLYNKATISHKVLNTIANLAGIGSLETGKLKWTVFSSRSINTKQSPVVRTIEVERPAGFAEIPTDLFLTGSATEGGETLADAIHLKQTANGVFEVYTSLQEGSYHFVDRTTGTPVSYYIDGNVIRLDGSTEVSGAAKVYRIRLDFNNIAVEFTEIKKVELWFAPDNTTKFELPYAGNSRFTAENAKIDFKQESWGRDERYKFKFTTSDGTTDKEEWWGSSNADNSRPDDNTAESFWQMFPINNNDQWNYCFKFKTQVDGAPSDFTVIMGADAPYTHQVVVR